MNKRKRQIYSNTLTEDKREEVKVKIKTTRHPYLIAFFILGNPQISPNLHRITLYLLMRRPSDPRRIPHTHRMILPLRRITNGDLKRLQITRIHRILSINQGHIADRVGVPKVNHPPGEF